LIEADDAYEISRGFTLFDSKKDAEAHLDKEVTAMFDDDFDFNYLPGSDEIEILVPSSDSHVVVKHGQQQEVAFLLKKYWTR
jgi:hypothetical protein